MLVTGTLDVEFAVRHVVEELVIRETRTELDDTVEV